ncbi:MAG: cation transporter [Spirochaetes bacterium]|nr:MAG: cation transporter [Spirochaetota bacterium]
MHNDGHDHDHTHGHEHGGHHHHAPLSSGTTLGLVVLFNVAITVAEYAGGILSGSLALISDAGHNLSDVLSLLLGLVGERVSGQGPSTRYSFGLKRFEVLIALVNSLALVLIGAYIVYESVMRYLNPVAVDAAIMLPVACVGLAGNVLSIILLHRKRGDNLNMRAAFLHLFYDAISSLAVIGVGIALFFSPGLLLLDIAVSLVIAVMIVWSSMEIVRESLRIFLQGTPGHLDPDEIYREMMRIPGITGIHGLHIWSVSSSEVFLSCHICLGGEGEPDTDEAIRAVNDMLRERFGITHSAVQVEKVRICSNDGGVCCR